MRVAHISLYPPKGAKHVEGSGVISYTRNLAGNVQDVEQYMLCQRIGGKSDAYEEDGILVRRCFDRNMACVWQIHQELSRIRPDVIHLQQEIALYGGVLSAYLMQYLAMAWRQRIVTTLHQVVDPRSIDRAFVHQNNSQVPVPAVRLAFRLIYGPLTRWSRQIIVHETKFKQILTDAYRVSPEKITVIPHGVEDLHTTDSSAARRKLKLPQNAQLVLFMGYASGYKGLDLLIEGFAEYARRNPEALLIIGAGVHPKLTTDKAYLAKYQRWQDKAAALIPKGQYRWVGFIEEAGIADYYSAADVSVYPYTVTLSSSGPMSLAMGYEKPFLASKVFADLFEPYPQLLFDRTPQALAAKLTQFFANPTEYADISAQLKQQRIWPTIGERTAAVYQTMPIATTKEESYEQENTIAG